VTILRRPATRWSLFARLRTPPGRELQSILHSLWSRAGLIAQSHTLLGRVSPQQAEEASNSNRLPVVVGWWVRKRFPSTCPVSWMGVSDKSSGDTTKLNVACVVGRLPTAQNGSVPCSFGELWNSKTSRDITDRLLQTTRPEVGSGKGSIHQPAVCLFRWKTHL
jgi:hypothetical protein